MDTESKFYQTGEALDYTPTAARTAGQIVQAEGKAGSCIDAIAANQKGAVQVKGIHRVRKKQEAMEYGNVIGWDEDGDPYGGMAGTGAATLKLADADFILGHITEDAAATDQEVKVELNEILLNFPDFVSQGFIAETVSANKTLDAQDVAKLLQVDTDAKTITLPATASGLGPIVIQNIGEDAAVAVNVSPNADDKIMGPDIAGQDNKDLINTKTTAKQGDFVIIQPDVAGGGWQVMAMKGIWATEG